MDLSKAENPRKKQVEKSRRPLLLKNLSPNASGGSLVDKNGCRNIKRRIYVKGGVFVGNRDR